MKKLLTVLLITMLSLAALFAAENNLQTAKESFRVEVAGTGSINTNILAVGLPHVEAVGKVSFLNNKVAVLGGVEWYNDFWLVEDAHPFQRHNYVAGIELYHNILSASMHVEDGEIGLGSIRYSYNWNMMEKKQGHFVYGVDLRAGLDLVPSAPSFDDNSLENGVKTFFLVLFSLIPRVSVGGTIRMGGAF